jgi:hypothetical protein
MYKYGENVPQGERGNTGVLFSHVAAKPGGACADLSSRLDRTVALHDLQRGL